jgi:hypothetical protein
MWLVHLMFYRESLLSVEDIDVSVLNAEARGWQSRDSAFVRATGYGLDERGVGIRVAVGSRICFFSTSSTPALGPSQPPIQWVTGVFSPVVKAAGV